MAKKKAKRAYKSGGRSSGGARVLHSPRAKAYLQPDTPPPPPIKTTSKKR